MSFFQLNCTDIKVCKACDTDEIPIIREIEFGKPDEWLIKVVNEILSSLIYQNGDGDFSKISLQLWYNFCLIYCNYVRQEAFQLFLDWWAMEIRYNDICVQFLRMLDIVCYFMVFNSPRTRWFKFWSSYWRTFKWWTGSVCPRMS